jgi:hypothetical protein
VKPIGFDSPEILIPTAGRVRGRLRALAFQRLGIEVLKRAQQEKNRRNGDPQNINNLTDQEQKDVLEALRANLEAKGWFRDGAGIR